MTHEFDGRKYREASAHQREWGASLIADLRLQGDERVLDLGCGDGALTARIADLVPEGRVLGIDASRGMIDAARARRRGNLDFVLMDIDDIDFDEEFDVVYSNAALHWVRDHQPLLERAGRSLRERGRLRFNFAGAGNCAHFSGVVREAISQREYAAHFADFTWPWYLPSVEEYRALVGQADLHEARVWGEQADRFFPDVDSMVRWLDQPSLVPFLTRLPEEARTAFRARVIRRMTEETRREDGRCFETFRRINVEARK